MATTDQYPQTNPDSASQSPYPYNLKDFAHASRLYRDGYYKHAPRPKWIYHVVFSIDPTALKGAMIFDYRGLQVVNMLAKSVELPKFKMEVEKYNQYNRSKLIQSKISYEPVTIVLHDTNDGLTTNLWNFYYKYYFYDSKNSTMGSNILGNVLGNVGSTFISTIPSAYGHNAYGPSLAYRYGLDSDWSNPFFRSIAVYQMSRHQYQSFMFVNPVISSWNHDTLDQADGSGICQHTMTIEYETVFYKSGGTGDDCPIGFSSECYDHRTSPLGPGPNYKDSSNITDIVGGIEGIVGGVLNGNLGSFEGLLQTGATIYGVVQSASNYNGSTNPDVGQNMLEVAGGSVGINGIPNMSFPKSQADTTNTQQNATPSAVPSTQTVESSGSDSEASHQFAFKNAFEPSILKSGLSVDKAKELWSNLTTEQKGNFYNVAVNMINTKSTFDLSNVMNSMDVTVNKTI